MDGDKVLATLREWYGMKEGTRVFLTVIPGILKDFTGMLREKPGQQVREEYNLEDGTGTIILTGRLSPKGEPQIEATLQRGLFGR